MSTIQIETRPQGMAATARGQLESMLTSKEFCSSRDAANALGVALGTVQQMVERGTLEAWKTSGGHRRIKIESLLRVLDGIGAGRHQAVHSVGAVALNILVVDASPQSRAEIRDQIESWQLPHELSVTDSCFAAAVSIGQRSPHIVIVASAPSDYSFDAFLEQLASCEACLESDVIVIEKDRLTAGRALARGLAAMSLPWPCPYSELRSFVQARLAQIIRDQRKFRAAHSPAA